MRLESGKTSPRCVSSRKPEGSSESEEDAQGKRTEREGVQR